MPSRVDLTIAAALARHGTIDIVYTEAVRPDAYFCAYEEDRRVLFVHPTHFEAAEALLARHRGA